ncbi:hypothetical protein ADL06_28920 [Streptomyces sp. NRRL F-6491]|nr:hypothetical protein ADL06_28920 [Streptomyces sp. NRRL F-6491]KOX48298.1 hypothetical protein ADL08_11065 [Streptomyces sp. NRRL F-6492]
MIRVGGSPSVGHEPPGSEDSAAVGDRCSASLAGGLVTSPRGGPGPGPAVSDRAFDRTESDADDRALLIAMVFLGGEEGLALQDAARDLLGEDAEKDVRTIVTAAQIRTVLRAAAAEFSRTCDPADLASTHDACAARLGRRRQLPTGPPIGFEAAIR